MAVAKKLHLTPDQLYRVLLAIYQDPAPQNRAWSQWLEQLVYDRKLGKLPKNLMELLPKEER